MDHQITARSQLVKLSLGFTPAIKQKQVCLVGYYYLHVFVIVTVVVTRKSATGITMIIMVAICIKAVV